MALLNRPSGRSLNGILLTLAAGETLIPAAVPIALVPLDPDAGSDLGVVRVGDRCFENIDAASTGSRSGTARAFLPELWPLSERR